MPTNIKLRVSYACECCHYSTYNKTDYERHIITPKHIKMSNTASSHHTNLTRINAPIVKNYSNIARVFTSI